MRILRERPYRYGLYVAGAILVAPAFVILVLRWVNPPVTAYMIRVHHEVREHGGKGPSIYYHWVDIGDMAACMPLAAVAGEDQTFADHHGFVWSAIGDAIVDNATGHGPVRGASTISQQTAKNLFLWPAKSYVRKAVEAYLTVWLELLWSKRRILEVYLNVAQFDDRVFGVGAAADRLFGVGAQRLSRARCAALAAVLPAPDRYSAADPGPYVRQRRAWILRQMNHLGRDYLMPVMTD